MYTRLLAILTPITNIIIGLPRLFRMLIVMLLSALCVLLLFPLVDEIYVRYFFDASTTILPSLVSVTVGSLYYLLGWTLIVNPRIKPTPSPIPILLYIIFGLAILIADIVLISTGISMLDAAATT